MTGADMNTITRLLFCAALTLTCSPAFAAGKYIAYVGTYTGTPAGSKGIYGLQIDGSGHFKALGLQAEVASPSFLAVDSKNRFLYAVTERTAKGDPTGHLSSYAIDPATGALRFLNRVPANGTTSAHLVVDQTRHWLLAANYGSGSVASFALKADGSIGDMADFHQHSGSSVDQRRQKGPHPHEVVMSPDNRFVIVPDLGLDKVFSYRLDAKTGKLTLDDSGTATVEPGFGPRHFVFGKSGKFAYVLGEMGSKVIALSYDAAQGKLVPIQTIATIPADFKDENNSGELALDSAGRFLYASNRGHDSVTLFSIDRRTGLLKLEQVEPSGGKIPRNIALDPSENHLLAANQDSDNVVVFNRDQKSGRLTPNGDVLNLPSPVCIVFVPLDGAH
jgi:6-phosphogluconolactonase